ncbi:YeeE/YedE thiosulfate transporter family protein [Phaeobacter sp.]|uniref:YeeE/YedE family protein n=1 Tax=Phaeobacter sp. TaxID=1902409 RepID=UPI0025D240C8|nr:YeeE/YedE thiosulfate transporter family protein [Phaeobacter sp.]
METAWIFGLMGGMLIGVAGLILLLGNGRIMGVSGIFGRLIDGSAPSDWAERLTFVAGLALAPFVIALTLGGAPTHLTSNTGVILAAGVLVGFGTRLANGCTSGHGVCGISRLSLRGLIATLVFCAAGAGTVALLRLLGVL